MICPFFTITCAERTALAGPHVFHRKADGLPHVLLLLRQTL
jgi:hypothetical protein